MAIDDPLDEHEQSEQVLEWLRRNGAGLIGGVVLGLAAIGGWKWWQHHQQQAQLDRATQYQAALDAVEAADGDYQPAAARVQALGEGTYATLAGLELAARQVEDGDNKAAIATLQGIRGADPAIAAIVRQRLARLLVDAGKAAEALELVEGSTAAAALEVRGDAHFALGHTEQARESYEDALARLDVASPQRRVVELKLAGVAAPVAAVSGTGGATPAEDATAAPTGTPTGTPNAPPTAETEAQS